MINNKTTKPITKLQSERASVYVAVEEWAYSHHPFITFFGGYFWAMWSNSHKNESEDGSRVLLARSRDGIHWEEPYPVVVPEMFGDSHSLCLAAGFYVHEASLNLYFLHYKHEWSVQKSDKKCPERIYEDIGVITTKDGEHWSEPLFLGLPMNVNHGPQKLASGRLIMCGDFSFPYTDDPSGIGEYHMTGIYGDAFEVLPIHADPWYVSEAQGWSPAMVCEGSFFQTDDGVVHMMLRSNTEWLWVSESCDEGNTWSEPSETGYSDDTSKHHFGRLPDGRFYGVSNATPDFLTGECRKVLYLCLSEDGENFDKWFIIRDEPNERKYDGRNKVGRYGYPHTLIHEGYMYVIYSKQKEDVEVTRFSLEELRTDK